MTAPRTMRRVALVLAAALVLPLIAATPAAAEPGTGESGAMNLTDAQLDLFPQSLRFLAQGGPEFEARYFSGSRAQAEQPFGYTSNLAAQPASNGCAGHGGDVGLYAIDYVRRLGSVIDAVSQLPDVDDFDFVTTPWPGPPASEAGGQDTDGVMPMYRWTAPDGWTSSPVQIPSPSYISSCGDDLAPFGQANVDSPWGFEFYPAPDSGSVTYFESYMASLPAFTSDDGVDVLDGAQSWAELKDVYSGYSYSPTDATNYCTSTDAANPLCLSAMFLHCGGNPANATSADQATIDCWKFNANTILLNLALVNWLNMNGPDGRFHNWIQTLDIGGWWPTVAKWVTFGIAVAAGVYTIAASAGGLAAFGIGRLLALIGVGAAVTATDSWEALWDVAVCSTQIDKCLAEASAKGLSQASQLVSSAAKNATPPSLSSYSGVFNRLAALSGIIMLILLLLSLCYAVFTGKHGLILHAALGAFRWAVAIGAGTVLLVMAFDASTSIADAIAGAGGSGQGIKAFSDQISLVTLNLGAEKTIIGWIMVALAAVIGALAAIIVWIILTMSYQFIPLAVGLMILQVSGLTGSESARKWLHRGWGLLWTILLLRPAITLLTTFAQQAGLSATAGGSNVLVAFLTGIVMLILAAVAPWIIVKMFPTVAAGGFGAIQGLMTAANAAMLTSRIPAAGKAIANRAAAVGRLMGGVRGATPQLAAAGGPTAAASGPGAVPGAGRGTPTPAAGSPSGTTGTGQAQPPPAGLQPGAATGQPTSPSTPPGPGTGPSAGPGAGGAGAAQTPPPGGGAQPGGPAPFPPPPDPHSAPGNGPRHAQPPGGTPSAAPAPAGRGTPNGPSGAATPADGTGAGHNGPPRPPTPQTPAQPAPTQPQRPSQAGPVPTSAPSAPSMPQVPTPHAPDQTTPPVEPDYLPRGSADDGVWAATPPVEPGAPPAAPGTADDAATYPTQTPFTRRNDS